MTELKEQRKQTQLALYQNTKRMEMLVKSGLGVEAPDHTQYPGKKKKAEHTCKNFKKSGYHEDDKCFTLEKITAKRPTWYVKSQK